MPNAMHFPTLVFRTARLLESALLLCDSLEFVTPWTPCTISYRDLGFNSEDTKNLDHAHSLISSEHVPSEKGMGGGTGPCPRSCKNTELVRVLEEGRRWSRVRHSLRKAV
jgi:hypothetical protein